MSTSYPEGETFFKRDSLKAEGYDPDDLNQFYTTFLIEIAVNEAEAWAPNRDPAGFGDTNPYAEHKKLVSKSGPIRHTYSYWDHWAIGYGPKDDMKRVVRYEKKGDVHAFAERWFKRDPQKVRVFAVPMPTSEEEWIWLHMLVPIRAVYFPLSQKTDKKFPDLATFIQVSFYHQGTRKVWHADRNAFSGHPFNRDRGIGFDGKFMLGINVTDVMGLLSLHRHFRKMDIWDAKLMVFERTKTGGPEAQDLPAPPSIDFVTLVNASLAVELAWRPPPPAEEAKDEWIFNILKGITAVALGAVPVAGPVLSAAFAIGMSIVADKDKAVEYLEKAEWGADVIGAVAGSSTRISKFLDDGWHGINLLPKAGARSLPMARTAVDDEEVDLSKIPPNPLLLDGLRALLEHDPSKVPEDDEMPPHDESLEKAVRLGQMGLQEAQKIEKVLDKAAEEETIRSEKPDESEDKGEAKSGCHVM